MPTTFDSGKDNTSRFLTTIATSAFSLPSIDPAAELPANEAVPQLEVVGLALVEIVGRRPLSRLGALYVTCARQINSRSNRVIIDCPDA